MITQNKMIDAHTHQHIIYSAGAHTHHFGNHDHTVTAAQMVNLYPDVELKVDDGGFYYAYIEDETGRHPVELTQPFTNEPTTSYVTTLTAEQLVAGAKMLYDRWAFVSGDSKDKELYEACEEELKSRRDCAPFLLHAHELPSHTHGGMDYDNDQYGFHSHFSSPQVRSTWRISAS